MSGCGYRLEGSGQVHPGVKRVAVHVFENKTTQTRAGTWFTNELIREIQEKTDTRVVDDATASRRIKGTVKSITFSTLSRSSTENVVERKVTAVVDVRLLGPGNDTLWSVKNFSSSEDYAVAADTMDDENNIREAVRIISERVSERLVSLMAADF